jgi:hypothetical protein
MVETFGVTKEMVITRLPIDSNEVNEDTILKPSDIDEYIEEGGALISGVLKQGGLDPSTLDDVTKRQAATYVFAYAVAESLDQIGLSTAPDFGRYRAKATEIHRTFSERPELFSKRVTRARYTGDDHKPLKRDFVGRNYDF